MHSNGLRRALHLALLPGMMMLSVSLLNCGATSHRACAGGPLSLAQMQFNYRVNDRLLDDHIYFSKEASSGGRGFGGGGCGCN